MEPSSNENLEEFCINRWMTRLKSLGESPESLDIDIWVQMLFETTNIFKKLGSAMAIAFSGK